MDQPPLVLIVEDDDGIGGGLMRALAGEGYRAEWCRTASDALAPARCSLHWFGSTKTLDVHVASLRQRLGESGPEGSRISTLRGVGYRLELA